MQFEDDFLAEIADQLQIPSLEIQLRSEWGSSNSNHRLLLREALQPFLKRARLASSEISTFTYTPTSNSKFIATSISTFSSSFTSAAEVGPFFYWPELIQKGFDFSISHASSLGGFAFLGGVPPEIQTNLHAKAPNEICKIRSPSFVIKGSLEVGALQSELESFPSEFHSATSEASEVPFQIQIGFDLEVISRVTPALAKRVCSSEAEFTRSPNAAALWTAKEAAFKSLKGPLQPQVASDLEITGWKSNSRFEIFEFKVGSKSQNTPNLRACGVSWSKNDHQFAVASLKFTDS